MTFIYSLSIELKCSNDNNNNNNPFKEFLQVSTTEFVSIGQVIDSFNAIKGIYPDSLNIVNKFPLVLLSLIQDKGTKGGLLPLFRGLQDRALLNQIVDRKIAEVDPTTHVLLVGLQEAREAFDVTLHDINCFSSLS